MPPTGRRPINEEFANQAYAGGVPMAPMRNVRTEREPEERGGSLRRTGSAAKIAGRGAQATGAGLKGTGTVLRGAGAVTTRAGAALSGTGVGAIVGVPLVAIGATLSATGTASRIAGQVSAQSGKQAVRTGSAIKKIGSVGRLGRGPKAALTKALPGGARILAVRATIMNISWASWLWIAFQVPIAIFAVFAFGIALGWDEIQNGDGGFIDSVVGFVANAADSVVNFFTGFTFDHFTSLFMLANGLVFLIGLGTMLAMAIVYLLNGVPCFFGKGAGVKIGCFILALVCYFLPILNLFPWAIVWALAIIMNPE